MMRSMRDAVQPYRMMIIRTVLYKDRFDECATNAGDITIRVVLNRMDISWQDRRIHDEKSNNIITTNCIMNAVYRKEV
jgi:hypothetical protein